MDRDQVHVGVEVGVEGPYVTPVAAVALALAGHPVGGEVVHRRLAAVYEAGDDVATDVMAARPGARVLGEHLHERLHGEDVVPHRGVHAVGRVGQSHRVGRLLAEGADAVAVRLDDSDLRRLLEGHADRRHRRLGAGLDVLLDQLPRIHAVDVVGADDDQVGRVLVLEQVEVLVDGVGRPREPVAPAAHLRGHRGHVVAEQRREPPGLGDVPPGADDALDVRVVQSVGQHLFDPDLLAGRGDDPANDGLAPAGFGGNPRQCLFRRLDVLSVQELEADAPVDPAIVETEREVNGR